MSFNVSALEDYVREHEGDLVTSLVYAPKTAQVIAAGGNVQAGIKSSEMVNQMETDAQFQAGGGCGFNPLGSTVFSQREIVVGKIKVHEALCPKSLEAKWTQKKLANGSQYDSVAFAKEYADKKIAKIAAQLEKAIWQGDKLSGDANLNKFDGFLKLITAAGGSVVNANQTPYVSAAVTAGVTASNAIEVFNGIYKALPVELLDREDVVIFAGWDVFRTYGVALTEGKYFINFSEGLKNGEIMIPNTNVKVIAVNGLNGTSTMVATYLENMYIGTDLLNEDEKYEMFFAKEADEVRFMSEWKYGVQFAYPEMVVKFDAVA